MAEPLDCVADAPQPCMAFPGHPNARQAYGMVLMAPKRQTALKTRRRR